MILLKYVCLSVFANGRSQFLLGRLGRCLQLFVSSDITSSHEFASHFGLAIFICEKHSKPQGNRAASASVYFNGQLLSPAEMAVTVGWHIPIEQRYGDGGVCVGGGVHAFAWVRAHVCAYVRPSVRAFAGA